MIDYSVGHWCNTTALRTIDVTEEYVTYDEQGYIKSSECDSLNGEIIENFGEFVSCNMQVTILYQALTQLFFKKNSTCDF